MDVQKAIEILDQAASLAQMNRNDHVQVQEAARVLREYVNSKSGDQKMSNRKNAA